MCLAFLCPESSLNQWHTKPCFLPGSKGTHKQTGSDSVREATDMSEKCKVVSYLIFVSKLVSQ